MSKTIEHAASVLKEIKAENRAIEKYPIEMYEEVGWRCVDKNAAKREYFVEGYHQAEKDLELTGEDMHAIAIIEDKLIHELCLNDQELPHTQEFYEEVLKRFKTKKEESC